MLFDIKKDPIIQSVSKYREVLFNDINLSLRVIDKEGHAYNTRVFRWDDIHITFYAPLEKGDYVIFESNTSLEIGLLTKSAMHMANLQIETKFLQNDILYYSGVLTSPLIKKQQREHFRLDTLLPLECKLISSSDVSEEEASNHAPFSATTVNISVGGMCMVCSEHFKKGTVFSIKLNFLDYTIPLISKLLDSGERNPNGSYTYRVKFCNLDFKTEALISKLIFEKQRQQLAINNNKPLYPQ